MAATILPRTHGADSDEAVREFVVAEIKSELDHLQRLALVTPQVYSRCVRYLERHPEQFTAPLVVGPVSSSDLVDWLLRVAS
jgi:hypothetical protein